MADILDIEPATIHDDTSPDNTPKWDSANHIQLVLALEQEFAVAFDVSEFESMTSFFEIVQMVQARL